MFISRVKLQNWRNFKSASAELSRRVFIIGPNASGKSNLLDAFRFLRDLAEKGLSQAVSVRGGVKPLRCLAARESPGIAIEVVLSSVEGGAKWKYRIEFNQDANRIPRVRREIVIDLREKKTIVDRPNDADKNDPVLLTQTALEQISANREFREVADFFGSISYQHIIPQVVRDPKGFSPITIQNDPFGRDFLLRLWNTNPTTRSARLKRISKVLHDAVPQLKSLEVEMDNQGMPHLVGRYEHWRAHDARQNESQFSDGTIRLLGLMWSMFDGNGPLLLEEPELSLHVEVVRNIPPLFFALQEEIRKMKRKGKYEASQILISTHSEEMLRDKSIGADDVLRIEPSSEGSIIRSPDKHERKLLSNGLTVADVVLPKSVYKNMQLNFGF